MIIASIFFIRETLPAAQRGKSTITVGQRYKTVLTDRIFVGMVLVGSLNFGGLFAYLSASTFLFQNVYGFSPQEYGILFGINSLGIVAGVQISSRLIRRVAPQWIVAGGATVFMLFTALLIVALDLFHVGLWGNPRSVVVLHLRNRLHVPVRPGAVLGQPRRTSGHRCIPPGRVPVHDGWNCPARRRLVGRQFRRPPHGRRHGRMHHRRDCRVVAGSPAPPLCSLHPLAAAPP